MNFLEQLAAEWYEYNGYFCRTNIRFGPLAHGGNVGEMDVIAYHPQTRKLVHIECSTDAWSWQKKKEIFLRKFINAEKYYFKLFPFNKSVVEKIAVTGFSTPKKDKEEKFNFGENIRVVLVPDFILSIARELSKIDPWVKSVHEDSYPLLRSIQFGTFYLLREIKKDKKINKK